MKVLQVTHRYWPFPGGSESYFRRLARDLVRQGHRATAVTTDAWDLDHLWGAGYRRLPAGWERLDGVCIGRFPVRHPLRRPYWHLTVKRAARDIQRLPYAGWAVSRRLTCWAPAVPDLYRHLTDRTEADTIIHAGNILFDGLVEAALASARRRSIPFVLTPNPHLGTDDPAVRRDYTSPRQIDLIRRADAVFAQTCFEARWLADRGVDRSRIVVAPDGPDLTEIAGGDADRARRRWDLPDRFVLYLGPTAAEKGFFNLIAAARLLARGPRPVGLVAAGPLTDTGRAALTSSTPQPPATVHQPPSLTHLGPVTDEERNDLLAACLSVALPSRTEALGRSLLEGWAYGKPAIAAQAGALAEVVAPGRDGLVVPFGDVARLAGAIRLLADNPSLADQLGQTGRAKFLAQYQWARSSRRVIEVMGRLEAGG